MRRSGEAQLAIASGGEGQTPLQVGSYLRWGEAGAKTIQVQHPSVGYK